MRSRLSVVAAVLTFAGSLAGFHFATPTAEPVAATPRAELHPAAGAERSDRPAADRDCPEARRLWEEA